nr:hypothetical protein [Kibdelosporangium sp. MJ126-NF4]CTQ91176.1 hypothetical protein [Kibdelosporangium sp. MJ126-NF4]
MVIQARSPNVPMISRVRRHSQSSSNTATIVNTRLISPMKTV